MKVKNVFIVFVAKVIFFFIKIFSIGTGSTWPGHIALKLNKNFIKQSLDLKMKTVLIVGTNGKTTTGKILKYALENNGRKVFQNKEGANLLNGIASAIIKNSSLFGKINYDIAILEVDENSLPKVLKQVDPYAIIILNLFRDQLDRYGEVNTIARKWKEALLKILPKTQVFLNADDPQVNYLGKFVKKKYYFGLDEKIMETDQIPHDVDSVYCPNCNNKMDYKIISYSHLGIYQCKKCKYKRSTPNKIEDLNYPLAGMYNQYNTIAAATALNIAFSLSFQKINKSLENFEPAFGRQEKINYKGKSIYILLSKNPTGFNQSIKVLEELSGNSKNNVLIVLNDRIPDGRDISWIWDVEFENLLKKTRNIFLSGDRVFDIALRMKYALTNNPDVLTSNKIISLDNILVIEKLKDAISIASEKTNGNQSLFILPTYSAMLQVRKIISGRKMM